MDGQTFAFIYGELEIQKDHIQILLQINFLFNEMGRSRFSALHKIIFVSFIVIFVWHVLCTDYILHTAKLSLYKFYTRSQNMVALLISECIIFLCVAILYVTQ